MPAARLVQPTISQIYATFDSASHRVFQAAMAHSTSGVVRVQDLLAALLDLACDLGHLLLPAGVPSVPARAAHANQHLVPMANEPALRETLRIAYVIAAAQPHQQPALITPATLWSAVFLLRHMTSGLNAEDAFRRLHLCCPAELRLAAPPPPPPNPARTPLAAPDIENTVGPRNLVDIILQRWLDAQTLPVGEQRDREMASIFQLTKHLESQPAPSTSAFPG